MFYLLLLPLQHKPAPGIGILQKQGEGLIFIVYRSVISDLLPVLVDESLDFSFSELAIRQGQVEVADGVS